MLVLILGFIVSLIPSVLIIIWLRKRNDAEASYVKSCDAALKSGAISILPIIGVSALFAVANALIRAFVFPNMNTLIYKAIYAFIVLAFAEELVKFHSLKRVLKQHLNDYSWADVVAFMVIVGGTFGLLESVVYAIGSDPITMIVRGITMGHLGYGFIMGWFYGKKLYTGKKKYGVLALVIPFFIHGLYDYSLTPELLEATDIAAFIAVSLALLDIILVVLTIRFFRKARKKEEYNLPLQQNI